MKFLPIIAVFVLFLPCSSYAAKCKVDGKWYPYDSPQCNAFRGAKPRLSSTDHDDTRSVPGSATTRPEGAGPAGEKHIYPMAQASHREVPPGYSVKSEVAEFVVDPASRPVVRRGLEPQPPPVPIDAGQRALLLGIDSAKYSNIDEFEEDMSDHFLLSASQPIIADRAYLTLSAPHYIDPNSDVLFMSNKYSGIGLHFKVEVGRVYLIDFLVRPLEPLSYRLSMKPNEHIYKDLGGSYNHILSTVKSISAGLIHIGLDSDPGTNFRFYAVSVTSVDAALIQDN